MGNSQHGLVLDCFGGLIVGWGEARELLASIKLTQCKLDTWLWQRLM